MNAPGRWTVAQAPFGNWTAPVNASLHRNPYLSGFRAGSVDFVLVNNHMYFGDDDNEADLDRRALECYAVARWADLRRSAYAHTSNVIAV